MISTGKPSIHTLTINYLASLHISVLLFLSDAFKRAIAPFNPFALQQVPTTDSIGFGDKFGSRWWQADVYKSTILALPN
jgi:hypothetical protein